MRVHSVIAAEWPAAAMALRVLNVAEKNSVAKKVSEELTGGRAQQFPSQ